MYILPMVLCYSQPALAASADIVIENTEMCLIISEDGLARSLIH